jgi:hypothetical protein
MREKILSIASDLREGSMTTSEAQAQLLRLFSVSERSSFEKAMYWYLKGFEDAETTESQPVSHEQTMKDAETHFYLVWDCHVNAR